MKGRQVYLDLLHSPNGFADACNRYKGERRTPSEAGKHRRKPTPEILDFELKNSGQ
jgi:hypothetical protein